MCPTRCRCARRGSSNIRAFQSRINDTSGCNVLFGNTGAPQTNMIQENKQKGNKGEGEEVTEVRIIKDRTILRCSNGLNQEKPRRKGVRRVYMHHFNRPRLLASLSPVENRILRISSWPYWNVCFLTLTGMTRRGRRVEKYREGWRLGDRCVRCSVLNVFLVVGAVEPAVLRVVILPGLVDGGGGGGLRPCVAHRSKPAHFPYPQNHRRKRSLRVVQKTSPLRPRRPHARMTC